MDFRWIVIPLVFAYLVYLVRDEIKDIRFYQSNGWDFAKDNDGVNTQYYRGDSTDEMDRCSNRDRVLLTRPTFIFGAVVMVLVLASIDPIGIN